MLLRHSAVSDMFREEDHTHDGITSCPGWGIPRCGKVHVALGGHPETGRQRHRVGLITNDQAPDLVDTVFLDRMGGTVTEVSGSCFCCNYQGLLDAVSRLRREAAADVLIAEPVGSCTDLSATIVQPLKDRMQGSLVVSPLSVLVEARRLDSVLKGGTAGLHPSAAYIVRKQIEEADVIVIS